MQPRVKRMRLTRNVRNRATASVGKGFPKKFLITHKYVDTIDFQSNINGVRGIYKYSCNSLFDPDNTSIGHQPMYFDNLAAIYRHYTVIGSKIVVKLVPFEAEQAPGELVVFISDAGGDSILSFPEEAAEQTSASSRLIPATVDRPIIVTKKWSAKKTFGGSILGNDNLQGTASASPVEQSYFTLCVAAADGSAQVRYYVQVYLEYITIWDELSPQLQN